jgi:hypothetical protein
LTPTFYLHPVKGRNDAPAGLILISDRPEDDGKGAALIAVDPGNSRISDAQADALAAELCRRYNAANEPPAN